MRKKKIAILGSTGSIGSQTLDVVRQHPDRFQVEVITAGGNAALLAEQANEFSVPHAVICDVTKYDAVKDALIGNATEVHAGIDAACDLVTGRNVDIVVASMVGFSGLRPTLAAIRAGKDIALANKETLVAAGSLVMAEARRHGVKILPVDSEHSAIFQCLQGAQGNPLARIHLTASGGPFRTWDRARIEKAGKDLALRHPNWSMGAKITIDSATMMNKGLEIIEAARLFDVSGDDIDVVVHRESIIHSLVEYDDNSVIAQLGVPDMRIPIQYAVTYPERYESPTAELNLAQIAKMTFFEPDYETFRCLNACKKALAMGGAATAIANGANEEANQLFRDGKIRFLDIGELVTGAVDSIENFIPHTVEDVLNADHLARQYVKDKVACGI